MDAWNRGVLYPARLPSFHRLLPPQGCAGLVRWFWIAVWDVEPGRVSRQHVVAYPASNLVVERDVVGLSGPTTRASHRDLAGRGWAVGALLLPAAVPSFTADPRRLRDTFLPLVLPDLHSRVADAMSSGDPVENRAAAVRVFAAWLTARIPGIPEEARMASAMAELIDTCPDVRGVEDAAYRLAVSPRTLQRLARKYVGLPPAAMIRRRRLQDAAHRVRCDPRADLAAIAADLGYADHAHLTNDFRAVLGFTPSGYRRETGW